MALVVSQTQDFTPKLPLSTWHDTTSEREREREIILPLTIKIYAKKKKEKEEDKWQVIV